MDKADTTDPNNVRLEYPAGVHTAPTTPPPLYEPYNSNPDCEAQLPGQKVHNNRLRTWADARHEWRYGSKARVCKYLIAYFLIGFIVGAIIGIAIGVPVSRA
ncbi:hypothetical protein BDV18DRAFT_162812 [Aspergillus unguis]